MVNKKLLSNPSTSVSSTFSCRKDKRANGSIDGAKQSERFTAKDKEVKGYLGIETLRDEPSRLEAMTVKELRTIMRGAGIPAKGTKQDLVSALRCFLLEQEHATAGHSSPLACENVPSVVKPTLFNNAPSKRKARSSSMEDNVSISEVSGTKQKRNRGNPQFVGNNSLKDSAMTAVTEQKLSVRTEEVIDVKISCSSRKVSLKIQSNDKETVDRVSVPENSDEPWTVLSHKKPQHGWVAYNPKTMRPPPLAYDTNCVKLMSWNVNGLRALLKLEGFSASELAQKENFDVLCLQETKMQEKDVKEIKHLIDGYDNSFWTCSVSKLGYSGTAVISRIKPISVNYGLGIQDHDSEGRLVTVEFDTFYLLNAYVPNSGDGLKRLTYRVKEWDLALSNHMKELEKSKPVILTGDLNCAHEEIDIYNPAGNRRSAGFTNEERESFEKNFLSRGFVDTFRKQHPGVVGYTYWGYRHNLRKTNKGWRLDYFLVSDSIADKVHDSYILPDVSGSDHSPLGLILKL